MVTGARLQLTQMAQILHLILRLLLLSCFAIPGEKTILHSFVHVGLAGGAGAMAGALGSV